MAKPSSPSLDSKKANNGPTLNQFLFYLEGALTNAASCGASLNKKLAASILDQCAAAIPIDLALRCQDVSNALGVSGAGVKSKQVVTALGKARSRVASARAVLVRVEKDAKTKATSLEQVLLRFELVRVELAARRALTSRLSGMLSESESVRERAEQEASELRQVVSLLRAKVAKDRTTIADLSRENQLLRRKLGALAVGSGAEDSDNL